MGWMRIVFNLVSVTITMVGVLSGSDRVGKVDIWFTVTYVSTTSSIQITLYITLYKSLHTGHYL